MKVLRSIFFIVGIISLLGGNEAFANKNLQSLIDATPEGATLHLEAGIYRESIVLDKSIVLEGEKGVIFQSCSSKPIITIKGVNISLNGVKIESCKKDSSPYAIYISGKNHRIEDIFIDSRTIGVKMENAENTVVKNVKISGKGSFNGFDLWKSHQNTFEGNQMDHVQDGFYMENSHKNKFIGNTISDSRYGLHVMFSNYITIKKNVSTRNYTGAMIMGTTNSSVEENKLTDNNLNVNAQGLLLYDVHKSNIINNMIANNRVGLYMEDSSDNKVFANKMIANFIGTQLKKIKNNLIESNTFISNVNEIQAEDGTDNRIRNNYWDAAWKLDTDGDGKSNLPYRADPYFLKLTMEVPEYQLFFQHPGMLLLQKMLKSPEHLLVKDESPLMKSGLSPNVQSNKNSSLPWAMSFSMIFSSLLFIFIGRKKR